MSNYREIKEECYEANLLLPEHKLIDLTFGKALGLDHMLERKPHALAGGPF